MRTLGENIDKLETIISELNSKRIDLSECKKAETEERIRGYQANSGGTTDRRYSADAQAVAYTTERYQLEADILNLESWEKFYTLCVTHASL